MKIPQELLLKLRKRNYYSTMIHEVHTFFNTKEEASMLFDCMKLGRRFLDKLHESQSTAFGDLGRQKMTSTSLL